jgi:chromosome segregation ATPase
MVDAIIKMHELRAIRHELEEIRGEIEALDKRKDSISAPKVQPSVRIDPVEGLQTAIADQLLRQHAIAVIDKRLSSLEQRLSKFEEHYGTHASLS